MHKESDLEYGAPDSVRIPPITAFILTEARNLSSQRCRAADRQYDVHVLSCLAPRSTSLDRDQRGKLAGKVHVHLTYPDTEAGQAPLAPVGHLI
ncbi:hypothetical protein KC342_g52 [Hortaea werneckii]|nr:hypothetical protein KC342_g52 [Hortaea werneckii]